MSVTHRSLSVAVESSFGSLSATTNLPDNSGLSYVSIPCERDPILIYGDVVASERNDARDGSYFLPPEPDTVFSSGSRVRRRTGSVNLRVDLSTIGSSPSNYNTNYLGHLLGAGFLTQLGSVASVTASSVADVNNFGASGFSATDIGTLLSSVLNGAVEYSAITEVSGTDITVSPAFSTGFTASTPSVRGTQTWYPGSRAATGTRTHSLSFRVDGVNFRSYAYGCVLESISISLDNGRLMADFTYQAALIQDDHGSFSGPIEPTYNAGAPPFFRNSYVVISSTSPSSLSNATTADALARTTLDCEDFTLTVTNTLTPLGHSESILAMSDMEITDVDVELSLTLSTVNTTINNDYFNRTVRSVLVGTGPQADGEGCAFMIPAAQLANDPSQYDVSGNDIVRQTLTYKQSRYAGDVNGGAAYESGAGCSPFRLSLGL
tara:strand:+ start:1200 stop:2504 length:1305 start_codon:yes stop_codon:yes gene_type:complete